MPHHTGRGALRVPSAPSAEVKKVTCPLRGYEGVRKQVRNAIEIGTVRLQSKGRHSLARLSNGMWLRRLDGVVELRSRGRGSLIVDSVVITCCPCCCGQNTRLPNNAKISPPQRSASYFARRHFIPTPFAPWRSRPKPSRKIYLPN
jgi:hypothetical protein